MEIPASFAELDKADAALDGAAGEAGTYSAAFDLTVKVTSRAGMVRVKDRWWGVGVSTRWSVVQSLGR